MSVTKENQVAALDETACWHALEARDPAADGRFWYGVRTTGIYCRPACASRLPRRDNVVFHRSPAAAEQAGFRPCKRCRPDEERRDPAKLVAEACRRIEEAETPPSLTALARAAEVSPFHFHRLFKQVTGVTPKAYGDARRAARLRSELADGASVTAAAYDTGFNSSARFYAQTGAILGMTPSNFRNGGQGTVIRFAIGHCSLGAILVAATEIGICAIELGDDAERLLQDFQSRFPQAEIVGDDPEFERLAALAICLADDPKRTPDLPLDIRGTAFQRRVWEELQRIPAGTTITYAELARRIGQPAAVRAVAGACAANKIALAIPCHRVVRTGGALSGYRWGIVRKRTLILRECEENLDK
jgi:AraC family transcriptional regulator of adaptative response/methylated-DNA-[protein]-cysteine methyltransferase